MRIVIALNCSMAVLIALMAVRLWQWRNHLQIRKRKTGPLQRAHIAETRLAFAQLQLRSRRIHQVYQLIQLLRIVLFYTVRLSQPRHTGIRR